MEKLTCVPFEFNDQKYQLQYSLKERPTESCQRTDVLIEALVIENINYRQYIDILHQQIEELKAAKHDNWNKKFFFSLFLIFGTE